MPVPYGSMPHIPSTNLLPLAAEQEPYKKRLPLNERYWRIFWKKFRRKDQQAEKDQIEKVTVLGRRTREEIAKWNQMTALRFQTGGRHQTSPASLRGCVRSSPLRDRDNAVGRDQYCRWGCRVMQHNSSQHNFTTCSSTEICILAPRTKHSITTKIQVIRLSQQKIKHKEQTSNT